MNRPSLFSAVIRDPIGALDRWSGEDLGWLVPRLGALLVGTSSLYGFSVGIHHSLEQGLYSAVKMPLVFFAPALLAAPALGAVADALGLSLPPRRAAAASLLAMTRVAVVALAIAPVAWLFAEASRNYEFVALSTAGVLLVSGLFGWGLLARSPTGWATASWTSRAGMAVAAALLFGVVTAQAGWLLRPFVLRPRLEPELFQAPESDIFTEIRRRL